MRIYRGIPGDLMGIYRYSRGLDGEFIHISGDMRFYGSFAEFWCDHFNSCTLSGRCFILHASMHIDVLIYFYIYICISCIYIHIKYTPYITYINHAVKKHVKSLGFLQISGTSACPSPPPPRSTPPGGRCWGPSMAPRGRRRGPGLRTSGELWVNYNIIMSYINSFIV